MTTINSTSVKPRRFILGDSTISPRAVNPLRESPSPGAGTAFTGGAKLKVVVYELDRTKPVHYEDYPCAYRYRISIDRASGLPQRIEHLCQEPSQTEWKTSRLQVFEYPADGDMKDAIRALFPE